MTSRADALLAGPRGRRLCLGVVLGSDTPDWPPSRRGRSNAGARHELSAAVAAADLPALAATTDPAALLPALVAAVDAARYWQGPDDVDALLADDAVAAWLRPVAEAVAAAPASAWWSAPLDPGDQHTVSWPTADLAPPMTSGARGALVQWRTGTLLDDERAARERPADPRARWSGEWWSIPASADLVVSTRTLPPGVAASRAAPAGLLLVEDGAGWDAARTWPVTVPPAARVLELTGPDDWAALVARHPLEVTAARRHDWWRVSGWDGRWTIPDWAAVAGEFDAVHLTVDGYLSTAGRAVPVALSGEPARTLLGGWPPDSTWWLTDDLSLERPTDWYRAEEEDRWSAAS